MRGGPGYPDTAAELADAPERLFVRGRWPLDRPVVAVVGARAATPYGLATAARLAADLARLGLIVGSGLAYGVDAAAHRGALEAGGTSLAVLPGGLDRVTPRDHAALAGAIAARGTLLSEWAPGTGVYRSSFLRRNRLIAALASAVVVVEARRKSGALGTAHHARRLGRPLLAVPGDVDRDTSRGCHLLLKGGAALCEGAADVVAALGGAPALQRALAPAAASALSAAPAAGPASAPSVAPATAGGVPARGGAASGQGPSAGRVLAALAGPARTAEECARAAGLPLPETQAALLELEWSGLARALPGARWIAVGEGS